MKKYNLYTKLKYQRRERIENIIYTTLNWCINKWGLKDHKYDLELMVTYKEETYTGNLTKAEYCCENNEITIYPSNNYNVRDLVDSVIHEFTHQRQDMSNYHTILEKNGYNEHPLEVEAISTAKKHRSECWYSIRDLINL